MKSRTEYLTFNLPARMAFENITERVAEIVAKSGVQEGLVLVNARAISLRPEFHGFRYGRGEQPCHSPMTFTSTRFGRRPSNSP